MRFAPSLSRLGILTLFWAEHVSAQGLSIITSGIPGCNFQTGKLEAQCIPQFIGHVIVVVFQVISVLFLINVMFGGYQIAMGAWQGEKTAGKDRLTWSVAGLIVSVSIFTILDFLLNVIAPSL